MEITKKQTNPKETVITFSGKLDFMVRKDFQAALQHSQTEEVQHIVLDFTQVSIIDCAAIGILVRAKQELSEAHITLSLLTLPGRAFDVLQAINVNDLFPIIQAKQEI